MDASEIDAGLRELREQIMGVAQTWLASQVLTLQVSERMVMTARSAVFS